jgi:hypothetical protein
MEKLLREIRDHGAPTSESGEVVDDCVPSPLKYAKEDGRYEFPPLRIRCEVDKNAPINAYLELGRIVLRSKKWIGIDEVLFIRTGVKLSPSEPSDISYHFMRKSHLEDGKDFDTELTYWNGCPTRVQFDEELVIKVRNKTDYPIVVNPGECMGTIFAIKPIYEIIK